jgi:hypothetical protein
VRPYLKKTHYKKGLVEWLKVSALSSNPVPHTHNKSCRLWWTGVGWHPGICNLGGSPAVVHLPGMMEYIQGGKTLFLCPKRGWVEEASVVFKNLF